MTLVPALARRAAHVAMLQRSPTYVVPCRAPTRSPTSLAGACRRRPPTGSSAGRTSCWPSCLPAQPPVPELVEGHPPRQRRGPAGGLDVDTHFRPRYDPWDQRLCLVPDGDLFEAIRTGGPRW